ncbi:MAG: hypothetical protein JWQ71_4139 [Pedosphaera sp.]|nr:hypothetical protein [Pedosphaera sp.]
MKKRIIFAIVLLSIGLCLQIFDLIGDKKFLKHGVSIFLIGTSIFFVVRGSLKPN